MNHVIAICGMMGSGKSTVIQHMLPSLVDSSALFEDDFNPAYKRSMTEIQDWWERGGDVEEFDLSMLAERLQEGSTTSGGVILLETQFGRLHPQLRPLIDLQCWIDVPSDIAFARKVAQLGRQALHDPSTASPHESLSWIVGFCENYVQTTRQLFERQRRQVTGHADLCISGDGSQEEVCARILKQLPPSLNTIAA